LPNAVTGKPVSTARLVVEIDLPSHTFVERQKTFIFRIRKIHHANLAAEREAYLMGLFLSSQCRQVGSRARRFNSSLAQTFLARRRIYFATGLRWLLDLCNARALTSGAFYF
jgi:hypothetical protein